MRIREESELNMIKPGHQQETHQEAGNLAGGHFLGQHSPQPKLNGERIAQFEAQRWLVMKTSHIRDLRVPRVSCMLFARAVELEYGMRFECPSVKWA